jgi:S-adenosylmethionine decarboxylase
MRVVAADSGVAGTHLLGDLYGCDAARLTNREFLERLAVEAARRAGATVCDVAAVNFPRRSPEQPSGITVVAVLAESHLSIHTYPEAGYAAVDIFTCGESCDTGRGYAYIKEQLASASDSVTAIVRGTPRPALSATQ